MPRPGDLVAFDVDGTLLDHPEKKVVWQVLSQYFHGSDQRNEDRLGRYRRGEISYDEWVGLDVGDWQAAGATRDRVLEALRTVTPVPGARETLDTLRERGYRLAVISGSLDVALEACLPGLPVDAVYLNRLRFAPDGSIAGYEATPYDMAGKARCLAEILRTLDLPLSRSAFVGDHWNDIEVARAAGFSIAWNPRSPELEEVATVTVRGDDMRSILPYFPA